jgi:hypothetical protein
MAKITILGTATRIFYNNLGVEVSETFKGFNGTVKTRKYTAWFSSPVEFSEGATGEFSGNLSTKIDEYTSKVDGQKKQAVVVQINDSEFIPTTLGFSAPSSEPATTPVVDLLPF